ncbi:hypothetical protein CON15_12655 [Bacillus cereus]|nr:hypothetical protein CON15_12655 [Bacillus cereus]PED00428.1 hypothetical protein CON14_23825 [Bacillus cereus]PEQ34634.1 hypothetical protein CN466_15745 [Bacillus cereus]PES09786.1 hypothetical protein CN501_23315 [Bacillus cereus]PEU02613.1 hypothetical protein CN534_06585 [Bacillus cereus]
MTSPFTFASLNISIATPNISAVFEIYRRNSEYISGFRNISAQLRIYQRFSKYIGATSNISAIFEIYRLTDKD